jgi:hypothetical protein
MYVNNKKNIPDYDHPFNVTLINDNSALERQGTVLPERVNFLCVFTSGKGRDNKVIKITSQSEFVKEFGKPNILKYGQPGLNAYASITDAYSHAFCMRVMPANATYSNMVIVAKYRIVDGKMEVKLVRSTEMALNNGDHLEDILLQAANNEEDEAGYKAIPLVAMRCLGRGIYGDALRVRLTGIIRKKSAVDYRPYRLEVLDAEDGNNVVEMFEGCLYDHTLNNRSLLLTDVLDGDNVYSTRIGMYINEDAFEQLFNEYKKMYEDLGLECPVANHKLFDPIYGLNNDRTVIENLVIDNSEVALDRLDGVPMMGGNDGDFANGIDLDGELLENLYIKAFSGDLDKTILSPRRVPVKYILDAGYPLAVKRKIVNLAIARYDAFVYLDAGIITTHDEGLIFGEDTADLNYRIVSKGYQHYQIRDPFSGKKVPVTYTYHLANQLAKHIELVGSHVPFVGERYALLTGAVKNTLLPILDEYDEDMKEQLYDLRLNYYEALAENVFARGTQVTAQDLDSDLSEEHNMVMTLEIKDIAEKETISRRYNFAEPTDRALFTQVLAERTKKYRDVVRNIDVLYSMTAEEEARSVLHCYVEITFKTIAKSSIVEININKRV